MRPQHRLSAVPVVALALTAACADSSRPTEPTVRPPARAAATPDGTARRVPRTIDDDFERVDSMVPGFGGFYSSGPGEITAYLTDVKNKGRLQAALNHLYKGDRRIAKAKLVVRQGRYGYGEMRRMYARVLGALRRPGLVYTDIDEKQHRLTVGVEDGAARTRAQADLASLGLPGDAYAVVVSPKARPLTTLQDQVVPVLGGVQITAQASGKACTLGVNAIQSGYSYYVTASHCTDKQGGTEDTQFYQPYQYAPGGYTYIGYEYSDPPYFTGGACPDGYACRYSDAALISKDVNHDARFGSITHTTYVDPNTGSITLDPQYPNGFEFVDKAQYPVVNEILQKVGQATGWTQGLVSQTCMNVFDGTYMLLCVDQVDAGGGGGDSGAPVFGADPQFSPGVVWYGILAGGIGGGGSFYMSSVANIEAELGTLTVY